MGNLEDGPPDRNIKYETDVPYSLIDPAIGSLSFLRLTISGINEDWQWLTVDR